MIPKTLKLLFYFFLRYPMRLSGWLYKTFKCPSSGLKVHLGPGKKNYLPNWVNVDANFITAKLDLWADLNHPLPFRDGSVDLFYAYHVIEHLPDTVLLTKFAEMFQALSPGGGIRIGAPHLGNACRKYIEQDKNWFPDYPDKRDSVGGRFTNFILCRGEHLTGLDESYLTELAIKAGFVDVKPCLPLNETTLSDIGINSEVLALEYESDFDYPHTVVIEARKPK
jgi:hypothetical protein